MPADDQNKQKRYDSTPSEAGKKPQDRGLMGANMAVDDDRGDSGEPTDEQTGTPPRTVEEAKRARAPDRLAAPAPASAGG